MKILIYADDRTGSSTLSEWLGSELGCKYYTEPFSSDDIEVVIDYMNEVNNSKLSISKSIIGELTEGFLRKKFDSKGKRFNETTKVDFESNIFNEFDNDTNQKLNKYLNDNPPNSSLLWEVNFYLNALNYDKIIVLGRRGIIDKSISAFASYNKELLGVQEISENGIIKNKYNESDIILNHGFDSLRTLVIQSYDRWLDMYRLSYSNEKCIFVSYEGIYWKMDDSIQKIKDFLEIDYFKSISHISFTRRNK